MPFCHLTLRGRKPKDEAYPKELKSLGDHIRKRRLELGLIQQEVAEKIGVDVSSVWNWETNRTGPELKFLPAIFDFLGYTPSQESATNAEKLVSFRQARGWSQKLLAQVLDVDPTTLSRWETGKQEPWGDYAKRIKSVLST